MLVIAAIALVGVKAVQSTVYQKCTADSLIFQDRIESAIKNGNSYGTVNEEVLASPCKYISLCLIDTRAIEQPEIYTYTESFPGSFLIQSSVKDGIEQNVFLISQDGTVLPSGYISQLVLDNKSDPLCFTAKNGKFNLLLYGKGRATLVRKK